jgi:hypothetical protein
VSNARAARLFDILLRAGKIDKQLLADHPNYESDLELARILREKDILTKSEIDALFSRQIESILRDALGWQTGGWTFSPLVKIRDGIRFSISLAQVLVEYARRLTGEEIHRRFRSVRENFTAANALDANAGLDTREAFVLSRFAGSELTVDEALQTSSFSERETLQILYALWLGGFLIRRNWNSVFTEHRVQTIYRRGSPSKRSRRIAVDFETENSDADFEAKPEAPVKPKRRAKLKKKLSPTRDFARRISRAIETVDIITTFWQSGRSRRLPTSRCLISGWRNNFTLTVFTKNRRRAAQTHSRRFHENRSGV